MQAIAERWTPTRGSVRQVGWRGRSGRLYALNPEKLGDFVFASEGLYVVARGAVVLWAGSAGDVIEDAPSRARFRRALDRADGVFSVDAGASDVERLTMIWDLEGAEPVVGLSAA